MTNVLLAALSRWGVHRLVVGSLALSLSTTVDPFCQWYHLEVKPEFEGARSAASWAGEHCYDTKCYEDTLRAIENMEIHGRTNEQWKEFFCGEGVQP